MHLVVFGRRLPIQSEFSVLKINLMAIPSIAIIFCLALACSPMIRFRLLRASSLAVASSHVSPANEEPNDEDKIFSGSAAARTVTRRASYGSGANAR
jgi:hypothetical protein